MSTPTVSEKVMGAAPDRVDGHLKVTGAAKYAVELNPQGYLQAYPVLSAISNGKITSMDAAAAEKAPGVRAVLTHLNAPKLTEPKADFEHLGGMRTEERIPLKDEVISYGGEYVALVVADTFERARYAATLVKISYESQPPALN